MSAHRHITDISQTYHRHIAVYVSDLFRIVWSGFTLERTCKVQCQSNNAMNSLVSVSSTCSGCKKTFADPKSLWHHKQRKCFAESHVCNMCGATCVNRKSFLSHVAGHNNANVAPLCRSALFPLSFYGCGPKDFEHKEFQYIRKYNE